MIIRHRSRVVPVLVSGPLCLIILAGCGRSGSGRYTPTGDEGRSSLDAALTAWRDGRSPAQVEATPPVRVVDFAWRAGQQVDSFRILGEEPADDGTKRFNVRLTMKKPRVDRDVRYVVHGRDPVWVYREDDYRRALNMDDNPALPRKPIRRGR
jgi:hypothetical protein